MRVRVHRYFCYIQGEANSLAKWESIFGQGTQRGSAADVYPPFAEVLARFEKVRNETLSVLNALSDEDLDKPSHAPEERRTGLAR